MKLTILCVEIVVLCSNNLLVIERVKLEMGKWPHVGCIGDTNRFETRVYAQKYAKEGSKRTATKI